MKFLTVVNSVLSENTYIVYDENTLSGFLIDPGSDREKIEDELKKNGVKAEAVFLTHGHFDHALSAKYFKDKGMKVYIHRADADKLTGHKYDMSRFFGTNFDTLDADALLDDGEIIEIAGTKVKVIHTPGHSAGGVCLYFEKENIVFTGDTLFCGDIGRTDFEDGNYELLKGSICSKLFTLPRETVVYPGHEESTSIEDESKNKNLFL
ncbi:MAG: MBL fold metallo-hydrolase [Clostridiales bacterium]|jgi:glyoxylase-like metal-dependent hydrolase (beta-lactamase superfamily II)|nr:MBL fold metallo-hydrolase [Clostridiales bacterium]